MQSLVGDVNRSYLRGAKGFCLLEEGGQVFHEQRKLAEKPFHSVRNDLSLPKKWDTIHAECSMFAGSIEKIKKRKISGLSTVDLV
jgi:hypothetical protein